MVRAVFPLLKKKLLYLTLFTQSLSSANIIPVSTKLGKNIYVQQNLNECDHGSNWSYLLLNWEKWLHSTLLTL